MPEEVHVIDGKGSTTISEISEAVKAAKPLAEQYVSQPHLILQ